MLEIIAAKAWNSGGKKASGLLRRLRFFPPSLWIALAVIIFFGGRMLWVKESRPAHRHEITDAFGSVSLFYDEAQINHNGSQFTYVATSDHGYGLFICDTATGHRQMVSETKNIIGAWGDYFGLHAWTWSPDNSAFIYSADGKLFVSSIGRRPSSTQLDVDANKVSDVVWLTPEEFAYVIGETNLNCARKQPDGQWELHKLSGSTRDRISCLTTVATNVIAWLQDNFICRVTLTEDMTGTNNPWSSLSPDANPMLPTNGLALWLDTSTLQQTDQTPVTGLIDLGSHKNNAIANGTLPIYNAPDGGRGLNGRGTIHFASNDSITNANGLKTKSKLGITGSAPRTVFAVMHRDTGRQMIINIGDAITKGTYFGICEYYYGICLADACGLISVIHKSSVDWNILEVVYDGTTQKGYINGAFKSSITYPLNTVDKEVEIGMRTANPKGENATASDGDFAELLIYNRALNDAERQQVEEYLSTKWFGIKPLSARNPMVWLDPKLNDITGFKYSKETGEFLLSRTENDRDSLWRLDPKTTNLSEIAEASSIRDAQWAGARDCAYISLDSGHSSIVLADASGANKTRLFERGKVNWFKLMPDGKKLLMGGMVGNEPSLEISQYDPASEQLKTIVSCSDYPSIYAKNITPIHASVRLPSGRWVNCTVYPPADFNRHQHKQYPLVIGDTLFGVAINGAHGRLWVPDIATCGAYVVIVDRMDWTKNIEQWGENVMGVYQHLIQDPCIDRNRVFLFGASAETHYMSEFLLQSPGLWKGVILLNPTQLPDFSKAPPLQQRPEILISAGGEEHEEDRLKQYQENALKSGVMVQYIIHPGEGHHLVGNAAQLQRTTAIMHFIFEE